MNRCTRPYTTAASLLLSLAILVTGAGFTAPATAQSGDAPQVRQFPKIAKRGVMVVVAPPEISMDGKADRLSPGARIHNTENLNVLSGALLNQRLLVNYTRDNIGQVQQVWILNSEEAKEKREGAQSGSGLLNFIFGSGVEKPAGDDGATPYDQLPRY